MINILKNITQTNYTKNSSHRQIKYIVIHYTANNGDTAYNNTNYFKSENRGASAHYFVDEKEIWQCVEDNNVAWHCGSKKYIHPDCRNSNSIGIELCSRRTKDGEYYFLEKTEEHTIELVRHLMNKYNIPIGRVLRHYDVTGKLCPAPYVLDVEKWETFKNRCEEVLTMTEYERLRKEINDNKRVVYKRNIDIPIWGKDAVDKAVDKGVVKGNGVDLDLSEDVLKTLVILDRLGVL